MKFSIALLCSLLVFSTGSAQAAVLLSDSFDSATPGLNDNLVTRQTGTLPNQSWVDAGNGSSSISSNQLLIDPSGNTADKNIYLNLDLSTTPGLVAAGEFSIAFDMTANSNYSGFFIGSDSLGGRPVVGSQANNDFQMLIKTGSTSVYYDNGSSAYSGAGVGTGQKPWVFTFATTDFNSGTAYTASLSIDGSVYDLNGGTAGTTVSGTWDGGTQYIGFVSRTSDTFVDNFVLTAAIPEPSTLWLAVAGLLGCGLFRRRK